MTRLPADMRKLSLLLALLFPAAAAAQSLPYWQDVSVTSVNAETQRTEAVWFADRADALKKGLNPYSCKSSTKEYGLNLLIRYAVTLLLERDSPHFKVTS